ncbi:MAG: DUF4251 domain-containing protein [Alloprevotella sp.]|nr:DUF4251 domain-containing protein [Alloprevotella sp.]MBR1387985.1 DUF4251 domain-containing protein [Alloprevotella sp.]
MKRMFALSAILCLGMLASASLSAQTTKPKKLTKAEKQAAMMQTIRQKVYSKDFKVKIVQAMPLRSGARKLDPGYSLRVKGDSLFCDMPYIGDAAMNMAYTGAQGLSFNEKMKSYSAVQLDETRYTVFLRVANMEDTYDMQIDLFNNGVVSVSVTPVRRDAIGYAGQLDLPREAKK